jgi:hypothetical protein
MKVAPRDKAANRTNANADNPEELNENFDINSVVLILE